jgi:hypothetical protein
MNCLTKLRPPTVSRRVRGTIVHRGALALFCLFSACHTVRAQESATPIISGGVQFLSTSSGGATTFQPVIAPMIAVPIGEHWLVESRATFDEFVFRENGSSGPWHAQTFSNFNYLQLDYLVNSHLTVVVGEFLTPFNIYNERLTPVWIHNLADPPLVTGIGTGTSGSSDGAMLRGVAVTKKDWELNYTAYFSARSNTYHFGAERTAGARVAVFIPRKRVEVGVSYQRLLQDLHLNSWGTYLVWQPFAAPLEVRAEYAHSRGGQGYWLEGAYRFSKSSGASSWIGRLQAIGRVQQFYLGTPSPDDVIPGADTQRVDFGLNYYLPHDIRLNGSYGRQFSSLGNANVWNLQVIYRFLFPLLPGSSK